LSPFRTIPFQLSLGRFDCDLDEILVFQQSINAIPDEIMDTSAPSCFPSFHTLRA